MEMADLPPGADLPRTATRGSLGFFSNARQQGRKATSGFSSRAYAQGTPQPPQAQQTPSASYPPPHSPYRNVSIFPSAPRIFPHGVRWVSSSYYDEALAGFNIYDPTKWLPTITYNVNGIMFYPWVFVTAFSFFATLYFESSLATDAQKKWVEMPLDAHIVMGGALSFLVVMRTDASYAAPSVAHVHVCAHAFTSCALSDMCEDMFLHISPAG